MHGLREFAVFIVFRVRSNGASSILANVLYCAKTNRDKVNGKHDQYVGYGDDRDPEFRMVL